MLTCRAGEGMLMDRPLDGQLRVDLSNLDFVALLVDALTDVTGRLSADLQLTGALNAPDINGRLELADAAASIDAAGIDLREVQVLVTGDPSKALTIEAQAKSGDGQVRAEAGTQAVPRPVTFITREDIFGRDSAVNQPNIWT